MSSGLSFYRAEGPWTRFENCNTIRTNRQFATPESILKQSIWVILSNKHINCCTKFTVLGTAEKSDLMSTWRSTFQRIRCCDLDFILLWYQMTYSCWYTTTQHVTVMTTTVTVMTTAQMTIVYLTSKCSLGVSLTGLSWKFVPHWRGACLSINQLNRNKTRISVTLTKLYEPLDRSLSKYSCITPMIRWSKSMCKGIGQDTSYIVQRTTTVRTEHNSIVGWALSEIGFCRGRTIHKKTHRKRTWESMSPRQMNRALVQFVLRTKKRLPCYHVGIVCALNAQTIW